jgi:hypothetical protein
MSLALFRSELRSAVRAAQTETAGPGPKPADEPREASTHADVLRRVARGELSVDAALRALGDR